MLFAGIVLDVLCTISAVSRLGLRTVVSPASTVVPYRTVPSTHNHNFTSKPTQISIPIYKLTHHLDCLASSPPHPSPPHPLELLKDTISGI